MADVFSVSSVSGGEKKNNSVSIFVTCYLTASMISISFFRRAFTRSDNSTPFASALAVRIGLHFFIEIHRQAKHCIGVIKLSPLSFAKVVSAFHRGVSKIIVTDLM
mgnify:CR=1 FL=1